MLPILYRDSDLVVCVKSAGLLSQDTGERSVPHLLREQLGAETVAVVHRLDREVGGIMVYALSDRAASQLSQAVQSGKLEKEYLAVTQGIPEQPHGTMEDFLFHDQRKNKTYVVKKVRKGVKDAKLDYEVLRTGSGRALVRVRLYTGRTHQIRVQFASRKLPLAGDGKYGGKEPGLPLLLWSARLSFPHPVTGQVMTFTQEPSWMEQCEVWFR